jgi:hypothetical protein
MSLFDSASLCVTPNAYKEDKLYSIKPTDGSGDLVVTRATTATRVNSAGLVELVPYNLVTYSEQFDNADWGKEFTTITANNIISPNGIQTADRFNLNGGTEQKFIYQGAAQNGTYTQSVYFKKGTHTFVQLATGGDVNPYCNFDLTNGTFAAFGSTATMTNVGNDWYRCTMTYTSSIATFFYIFASNSLASARTPATSSTGNFYAWGAQLVKGSSAKEYFPTTDRLNVPRIDYTNGSCPSILVEPQRTNLALYSEQFDNAAWTKIGSTITANSVVAPNGTTTADKFESSSAGTPEILQTTSNSNSKTISFYAKAGNVNFISLWIGSDVKFDLSTGTVVTGTATIESVGNGWYRCVVSNTTFPHFNAFFSATASGQFVYLWGAQVEEGSYATSYIPTVASSVTRNADVISKTGISSLIGQTEGTMFVDAYVSIKNEDLNPVVGLITINNNVNNIDNCIIVGIDRPTSGLNNRVYTIVQLGGATVAEIFTSTITSGRYKIAFAYKQNDFALYVNGVLIGTDTSGNVPTCSQALIGSRYNGDTYFLGDEVNAAVLWKTRLTNAELASLTTI